MTSLNQEEKPGPSLVQAARQGRLWTKSRFQHFRVGVAHVDFTRPVWEQILAEHIPDREELDENCTIIFDAPDAPLQVLFIDVLRDRGSYLVKRRVPGVTEPEWLGVETIKEFDMFCACLRKPRSRSRHSRRSAQVFEPLASVATRSSS